MMSGARAGTRSIKRWKKEGKKAYLFLILVAGGQHHRGKDQRALIRFTDPFFG